MPVTAADDPRAKDTAQRIALPEGLTGLTSAEVALRVARGEANNAGQRSTRSTASILRANIVTRFNALLGGLFVVMLIFGAIQDALFGLVLVFNTTIGVLQEWRAKRTLDRLNVLIAPGAWVLRDGRVVKVTVEAVVKDDVVGLSTGDQVAVDGPVLADDGLEIDESLLTGEAEPVAKGPGDHVLSGSLVVAGSGWIRAEGVGEASYARRLAAEAKEFRLTLSELRRGIDGILRVVTWLIGPVAVLLLIGQLRSGESFRHGMAGTVAGLVGMVPEGLVLLTSMTLAVSVLALARRNVLVQELAAVEGLARVDVVCFDKTGTLTDGGIAFDRIEPTDGASTDEVTAALAALAASGPHNATMEALVPYLPPDHGWRRTAAVPFSSRRKWTGASFADHGSWLLGAPELLVPNDESLLREVAAHADQGLRVLLLAWSDQELAGEAKPDPLIPKALVCLTEHLRPDAAETVAYLGRQQVQIKVISGDNPVTVAAIARGAGIDAEGDAVVDAHTLDQEALDARLDHAKVFGRTSPQQKKAMVAALQAKGHAVAMTGDGVNDALALKTADLGIAMGSAAAPATRAIAQVVVLDGRFASLPRLVEEGRRVINNVERVAKLFVTKTVYATLVAIASGVVGLSYPFLPRHLTLVSALTIGIPGFFLALGPGEGRYQQGFARRVGRAALPAGFVAAVAIFSTYAIALNGFEVRTEQARTVATVTLMVIALWVLVMLARPFTRWRAVLVGTMIVLFALAIAIPTVRHFYALRFPRLRVLVAVLPIAVGGVAALEGIDRLLTRFWGRGTSVGAAS